MDNSGSVKLVDVTKGTEHANHYKSRKNPEVINTDDLLFIKHKEEFSEESITCRMFLDSRVPVVNYIDVAIVGHLTEIYPFDVQYSVYETLDELHNDAELLTYDQLCSKINDRLDSIKLHYLANSNSKYIGFIFYPYSEFPEVLYAIVKNMIDRKDSMDSYGFKYIKYIRNSDELFNVNDVVNTNIEYTLYDIYKNSNKDLEFIKCKQLYTYGMSAAHVYDKDRRYEIIINYNDEYKDITLINSYENALNIYKALKIKKYDVILNVLDCTSKPFTVIETIKA